MAAKGAILFLFDRNYLVPFKVLAYTLRHALKARTQDLVIITDDPEVESDPFVAAIGARIVRLTSHDIERLKAINARRIRGAYKTEDLSAYWLLKFYVFKDLGYDHHIFLDADMLCLDASFRFGDLDRGADFCCARTIGQTKLGLVKGEAFVGLPEDRRESALKATLALLRGAARRENTLNSGVMFAGGAMLGDHVCDALIGMATNEAFRLEQDVVHAYLLRHEAITFAPLPVACNFPTLPAYVVGEATFAARLLPRIAILHYNRHPKPWLSPRGTDFLVDMWWTMADEAEEWIAQTARTGPA